jgi:quercetin dioxygenase-like cupin family protein
VHCREESLIEGSFSLKEAILRAQTREAIPIGIPGVDLYTFVSEGCGASNFSTGIAKFKPSAFLPYHCHAFSEVITVLHGSARVLVEGRAYRSNPRDSVHIPAGVAHQVENHAFDEELVAHWSFATPRPSRELINRIFPLDDRGTGDPTDGDPETIVRYKSESVYELSKGAFFLDLFARRFGAQGICGGHGRFLPGASLPCHIHDFDESITIVKGTAVCLVQGRRYELSDNDTAFVPKGLPHRFLNLSDAEMAMVWVYAGDEPDRRVVQSEYCSGELAWRGAEFA